MATLTEIKNQFAQNSLSNPTHKASSGLLTDNQRQAAFTRYQKEQEEKEKNQGGFWGGLGYVFEKIGLGFLQSIEGIWDYTAGGLADLFGAHDWAEKQIANDWVNYNHADEWFNPSDGWKVAGDVAGGIGTSLPALGAVAAAAAIAFFSGGTLAPAAAGLIGGVVAGLGAAGTATKEAYRETGELNGAAWGYGTLSGFTEGVMEGVSDVIGFGVGSIAKNLAKSTAKEGAKQVGKQIAKSAARQTFGKTILSSFLSEAFEEGVQELLDPVWKRVTYDPNAENATFQEVAYAALIGGLSGAIMGGADVTVRNSINYFSGSRINGKGGAKGVIDLATTIAETEGVNQSGNAQVDFVVNTLSELQESLQKTNGEVKTAKQKMLVGILSKANTAAPLSIVVSQNADAIVHDAETTVKRLNDIGYKTSDGKTVTPEMLTQGVTGERGTREYRRSLSDAMRTNEALRTVAVMSAAGQLNMDAARFQESTLRGEQLATQADLNHFIETATEAQKRDVGERLGITDWATVTADELKSRVREFSENGGVDQYINERNEVKKLSELEISKKGLPKYVGSITQDGAVRYKFGDASVAIVKNGDTYRVYDYARDIISKPLSKKEANRVIKEIYAASTVSETSSDTQSVSDSQKQTQEIDTFAREHVPDYKRITGAQQQAVRQTLRQARAAKISEADQILYASVAARSGANIEFVSAETLGANADAGYSMKDGKILVNREMANSPKARTAAKILLHEFTHAMIHMGYSVKGKKGKQHIENKVLNDFFTTAIRGLSAEQQLQILTPYIERHGVSVQDFIDGKVDISIDTYIELREELAAHFVERELGNSAALKRIISDKPTFKDKLLAFLKRAKSDYGTTNEKMSRAANALLKKYQTFFNQHATQNRFSSSIKGDLTASDNSAQAAEQPTGKPQSEPQNSGKRFALTVDGKNITGEVEQTKNLVALHNLSEQSLLKVLQLGGFPMPSIAVTRVELPHENYGNITVVFGRETIDPEINSDNRVYDRDAWTPTAPRVDVKLKEKSVDSLTDTLKKEVREYRDYALDIDRFFDGQYRNNAGEYVVNDFDFDRQTVGEKATHYAGIMAAYLREKGIDISPIYAEGNFTMGFQTLSRAEVKNLLESVGITKDITRHNVTDEQRSEILDKYIRYKVKKNLRLFKRHNEDITFEELYERSKKDYNDGNVSQLLFLAEDYYNENRAKTEYDSGSTERKLRQSITDTEDFYTWVWDKISNMVEKRGVDNDSDVFDRAGNRRSFEQRHYAYTVENIVRAMSKGTQKGVTTWGMTAGALAAKLAIHFDSVESIHAAKDYLQLISEGELKAFNDRTYELYDEIVSEIAGDRGDFMSNQTRRDDVGGILGECAAVKPLTAENIRRKFASETRGYNLNYKFNEEISEKVLTLFQSLQHVPTTYFEAKPRRAVALSEIKRVLVPESVSEKLIQQLTAKNIPYQIYGTKENARTEAIQQMDGVRFALSETDSQGRTLTAEQRKFFKDTKVVDEKGNLLTMYHGTKSTFYTFNMAKRGSNGAIYGVGYYFTADIDSAKAYGKKIVETYLNIKKPISLYELSISKNEWRTFLQYANEHLDEYISANEWQGNRLFIDSELNQYSHYNSDVELIRQFVNGVSAGNQIVTEAYLKMLTDSIGYDGVFTNGSLAVVFNPDQIKLTTNKTPTSSSDIRYALSDIIERYEDKTDVLSVHEHKDKIAVSNIVVKKNLRNSGIGQAILSDIIGYADANNKTITLTPTSEFGTKERLKRWYKRNGFVENKGRNTDFTISDTMYRLPQFTLDETTQSRRNKPIAGQMDIFSDIIGAETDTQAEAWDSNYTKQAKANADNIIKLLKERGYEQISVAGTENDQRRGRSDTGRNGQRSGLLDLETVRRIFEGAGVRTHKESELYSRVVRELGGYSIKLPHAASVWRFGVINEGFYTYDMLRIADVNKSNGVGTVFYLDGEIYKKGKRQGRTAGLFFHGGSNVYVSALLSENGTRIPFETKKQTSYGGKTAYYFDYLNAWGKDGKYVATRGENNQGRTTMRHERLHLIYDAESRKLGKFSQETYNAVNELKQFVRQRFAGKADDFHRSIKDYYVNELGYGKVETAIEEIACDLYCEDLVLNNETEQADVVKLIDKIDKTLNGVVGKDGVRYALDMSRRQEKTSAATSINSAKLPVLYGKVEFKTGTVNLDIGGGRFDNVTQFLATKGVRNYIYDPYNRSAEHNAAVARVTQEGQSDTVTISNVLNVIDSLDGRRQVLENAVDAVKPDGTVYITVYEGDASGVARSTGKDQFQLNRKTADYVAEVREYFDDVTVKNKVIIAKSPKKAAAMRYALNPTESDNSGAIGGLTRGQRAKFVANNTRFKVYSKMDAASVIDAIIAERLTPKDGSYDVKLSGKNRAEVIEKLFTKLNNTPEGYRLGVALDIADYMINNAVLTEMFDTYNDDSYTMGVLSLIRGYMHRMDLSSIQSEIQHKFDKKNSINLVWGAKSGGIAPDVVAQELEGYGIRFNAINAADQFFEMLDIYEHAREQVNKKAETIMLTAYGSETEIEHLRQEIARDVLNAYDEKGTPSKYAKLVEKYTKKIASLREDLSTAYKRNTLINRIIDGAAYLRDIATKRNYVGAEIFAAPELTSWLKQLSKIKYRSDLRKSGARKILLDYGQFYNTNNALLYDENPDLNYIDENVLDALNFIRQNALSNKPLSLEELQAAQVIIASAKHLFNTYDQITIEGKKQKITELATDGNAIIQKSKNRTSKSFFNKIYGVFNKIIEPRVVIKSLENFDPNGILTRAYNEITRGETEAALLYIELTNDIDTYIKKHKHFKKRLTSEYITVAGAEITVGQAISLYELSKRPQAQEGLRESGFSYIDKKGSKQTARITEADITTLFDAFTDTDKGFIELVETFFNVASKQVKTDADIEILGYTNASEEFYFPIKRDSGTIAKNITDARSIMADWANVYNFSFNKDVKTGAKNKLFVTDVYSVITRHAKQLSTYARMTVPLKNFSQIYAKNIGDKTNVISIRNTINEQVWGGAEGYLSKLFADIQGRATSSSFIEKMRGAYAKYQLGANLKVIVSQITSYPTAGVLLDTGVMAKGFVMRTNWAAMDKYCPYARVRNYERGIVRAEGVVDKVGKVGDVLTKPIQWTDRFTIGRLWNACQLQIQKDTGLKYGSVENMQKAGALLEDVIRLTQPNYTNTERSELMRSDSDIVRSFTMFTSVPLKQLSRLVESFGEYSALRSLVKTDKTDATAKRYKLAKKKLRRTLAAVTIANLMYVLVGQFFKFLYNDMAEDEKEGKVTAQSFFLDMLNDFGSTTVGMLPVVRDIYGYFANGYEINSFTGDMLNGILSTTKQLFELATKAASGEDIKTQDYMGVFRNSLYGIGQITGIPVRNINNMITGLIRRFNPSAAYSYTSLFYNPKYSRDINAALKKGDYELAETIMGMMLNDDRTGSLNAKATRKLIELYDAGYTVLPKSIGDTLTYKGEEMRLTSAQQSTFKAIYGKANAEIEKTINSMAFATLPAEQQAKAIKLIYDAYYSRAQSTVLNLSNDNKIMLLSGAIPPSALAPCLSAISAIDSDTDKKGNVINASKKEKVIKYVLAQKLTTAQKLLLILSMGYTIKDGDIKGVSAAKAKSVVARYISNLSLSRAEKTALAEKCGLKVRNGRIYAA